ncbi:MAG: 3'(2'),5'-bisphosphate nucleotidase CysQ, partial [Gammaproteobacteria bacterium]|nr:3'(2'),5'-bisphosphate nucleotidase CysQ [Gammaproteobacteria bacterium]
MKELLDQVVAIAKTAGEKILTIREKGYDVELKSDQSPVTLADTTSSDIILSGLEKLESNLPVICEETVDADYSVRKHWQRYWLVDPLDGTKSFVSGTDDFAVLIALIENNKPVLG